MNILLLGSGGRENAFAWKMAQSPLLTKLFIAPGNSGTSKYGTNVDIKITDFNSIKTFCLAEKIEMVIVGPEDPLVHGIVDFFLENDEIRHIPVIGPDKKGAALEGSKDIAKVFMAKYNVPTAAYKTFTLDTYESGCDFLDSLQPPFVLKADGLAAGKGVLIIEDRNKARTALKEMLEGQFGQASAKVVIEQFLHGIELSVFVLTDGISYKTLPAAKDYKRLADGDMGPNTGGMGAVSPVPFADPEFIRKVEERIVKPTINGFKQEGMNYKGFVFIGLMNVGGDPYVIEYNVRMGDPETEVVIPRINSDLVALFISVANGALMNFNLVINPSLALTVMLVSNGYPGDYEKGKEISKLDLIKDSIVFHAGATIEKGKLVTNGGRVMAITSFGDNIEEAQEKSMKAAHMVDFEGKFYRRDIGDDLKKLMTEKPSH